MDEPIWNIGDRCLVVPNEGWLQPTRRLAAEARPATIVSRVRALGGTTALRVEFDVKRKEAKPHDVVCYPRELQPTPEMLAAGVKGSGEDSEDVALGAWENMIDDALKHGKDTI